MYVELHTHEGKVGEYHLVAGRAVASNPVAKRAIENLVVVEPGTVEKVTPEDGERYLRALPVALSGSYAWAELVEG